MIADRRHCFGYGSLANSGTHDWPVAGTATLSGWRRNWAHRSMGARGVTALTIEPAPGSVIAGQMLAVPDDGWANLDQREAGYDCVIAQVSPLLDGSVTYVSEDPQGADRDHPIWLSYVDTVLEGFLDMGGLDAVDAFVETTVGWDAPILDDRGDKLYPRATALVRETEAMVDGVLANLPLVWMSLKD